MFFGPIGKTRWPPWTLIGWDIFDFSSETAERNSRKLDRKQDLSVLYQVFVFLGWSENKMAALASDWLKHFRLLLWNRWTDSNETWQEVRSQRPLPSLYFSGLSVNKNGRPSRFLKKVAHCTQVHVMWPYGHLVQVRFWAEFRPHSQCKNDQYFPQKWLKIPNLKFLSELNLSSSNTCSRLVSLCKLSYPQIRKVIQKLSITSNSSILYFLYGARSYRYAEEFNHLNSKVTTL